MTKESISLLQLSFGIKKAIGTTFNGTLWVRAEIAELRENRNGHCYLDLIEKKEGTDQIAARIRAIIWSSAYRMLKPYFESTTGQTLTNGLKVLVQVAVEYQELYGLSLIIRDIDPTFTLGDLEKRKRQIIERLQREGIMGMNRELPFPLVPQRIAVISSPTAAGYGDFVNQLNNNSYGITFYHQLFPAIVQGEQAPASIIDAFDKIYEQTSFFEAVVLIRGGGASVDLLCFDDYLLACNIAQYPLPVLTGIGHDRDSTIADLVAYASLKTPTAVAEYLIARVAVFINRLNKCTQKITVVMMRKLEAKLQFIESFSMRREAIAQLYMQRLQNRVNSASRRAIAGANLFIQRQQSQINARVNKIVTNSNQIVATSKNNVASRTQKIEMLAKLLIKNKHEQISILESKIQQNNPIEILKRGYTLTVMNGKTVKSSQQLKTGDVITTIFYDGKTISRIESNEEQ